MGWRGGGVNTEAFSESSIPKGGACVISKSVLDGTCKVR